LQQKKKMEVVEGRKRQREMKKYGKQVQLTQEKEKIKQKKDELKRISDWKKNMEKGGSAKDDEFPIELEDGVVKKGGKKPEENKKRKAADKKGPSKKRASKNERYGFGGKRRGLKKNTKDSASDTSGFSSFKNKKPDADLAKRMKKTRPGKSKRQSRPFKK